MSLEWAAVHQLPGAIVQRWTPSWLSRVVCRTLGSQYSHDALVVMTSAGSVKIGDCLPSGCRLTELERYIRGVTDQGWRVRVLVPEMYTVERGLAASDWWFENVRGHPYDFSILWSKWYIRLMWRVLATYVKAKYHVPIPSQLAENFEFAYWCTEGVAAAWLNGPGIDIWRKRNPTPRTTEKRCEEGKLRQVLKYGG